jgi:parallel beta-helix repeat protein
MTISGNTLKTNQENGMILSGNTGSTVSGNVVSQNRLQGVVLTLGASGNRIQSNTIDRNGGIGVVLSGATTLGNSIYGNVRGGISLLQGANRSQVAPRLTSARVTSSQITIAGTITGRAGDVFRIQYFWSQPSDATSAGTVQGRTLIRFRDVTLTSTSASINATLTAAGIPVNAWISATATRLVSGQTTDTSQFSAGVRATA